MAIEHDSIVDGKRHEPKGIGSATTGQVYVADGAGAGAWEEIVFEGLETATSGDVFISDGAGSGVWQQPGGSVFGSAYFTENTIISTNAGLDTYSTVDPLDTGASIWAQTVTDTIVFSDNKFTIPTNGIYEMSMCFSFAGSGGGAGNIYTFSFAVGGVPIVTSPKLRRQTGSSDVGSGSRSTYQQLTAGDELTVMIKNETSGTNTATISDASFTVVQLKELP